MSTRGYSAIFLGLFLLNIFTIAFAPPTSAQTQFFPVEEIQPGMKGIGYSVFSGTQIESFGATVLSVVEDNFGKEKLILVKLSGDHLKEHGGLAAGMSGSPVYIKNRLLGAISFGFENADSFLALVTPISSMLKLMSGEAGTVRSDHFPLKLVPVVTPVMISGMGTRAYKLVQQSMDKYGLKTVYLPQSAVPNQKSGGQLKPGSAIAVQMVSGDYQVAAIGTVTMVDSNNFLAFGHSFSNKGNVDYLALQAYIVHTVKSPVMSFKIGIPLEPVGRIIQDRQAGILGRLGESPTMIPISVTVTDVNRAQSRRSNFQVVKDEHMYRDLICSGVTDAIDQTIDRVGSGTAQVAIHIETVGLKDPIVRDNLFYGKDIAVSCLGDLRNLLDILANNEFDAMGIRSLQVEIKIRNKQETARIVKLEVEKKKFKPGETFKVGATLHTFRGDNLIVPLEIKLPDNIEPGKLSLSAHGGIKDSNLEDVENNKKETFKIDYKDADSLPKLLENYLANPCNNHLVIEYQTAGSSKANSGEEEKDLQTEQLKSLTQYYIFGEAQLTIEIIPR